MAKTYQIPSVQNINNPDGTIVNATGTTKVTVFTAGANDSVVKALTCSNSDTIAYTLNLYVNIGGAGTDRLLTTISVPASAGNATGTPAVDILRSGNIPALSFDAYGNNVLNLKAGSLLKAAVTSTVTAAKNVDFSGDGGDY